MLFTRTHIHTPSWWQWTVTGQPCEKLHPKAPGMGTAMRLGMGMGEYENGNGNGWARTLFVCGRLAPHIVLLYQCAPHKYNTHKHTHTHTRTRTLKASLIFIKNHLRFCFCNPHSCGQLKVGTAASGTAYNGTASAMFARLFPQATEMLNWVCAIGNR